MDIHTGWSKPVWPMCTLSCIDLNLGQGLIKQLAISPNSLTYHPVIETLLVPSDVRQVGWT